MASPSPPAAPSSRTRWSGWVLTALFLIVGIILFTLIYVAFPANAHYNALLIIGVLALILALCCYLAESFSRDPTAQRSLAWGFFGMGFAVLLLSIGLGPYYSVTTPFQALEGLIVVIIVLAITIALIGWRLRAVQATAAREGPRQAWRNEPAPSAFSYAAANSPSVPTTAPPATPPSNPANPPRSP
jgi:hypothetical protein